MESLYPLKIKVFRDSGLRTVWKSLDLRQVLRLETSTLKTSFKE